jgi:hypothetical protein
MGKKWEEKKTSKRRSSEKNLDHKQEAKNCRAKKDNEEWDAEDDFQPKDNLTNDQFVCDEDGLDWERRPSINKKMITSLNRQQQKL